MAYIICQDEEAILAKNKSHPSTQSEKDLALVIRDQRIAVVDNSVKLISDNLAMLKLAGRFTWIDGAIPILEGSILYFNPKRFNIPSEALEKQDILIDDFPPPISSEKTITKEQIVLIAQHFHIQPETLQAVLDVESSGGGFLSSGKPKILFEAHWFGSFTGDSYNDSYPDISCYSWEEARRLYSTGEDEWKRLEKAIKLSPEAAYKSASWGIGQIMGFNYETCGYSDIYKFVSDMQISEAKQVEAMFKFIESKHILDELQRRDWAGFAFIYNGEGFKINDYDTKLDHAYQKHINAKTFQDVDPSQRGNYPPPTESIRVTADKFDPNASIDWNNPNCRISKYFTVAEVTQRDQRRKPQPDSIEAENCVKLARELDKVREAWDNPIGVTSWYRPEPINSEVGGVANSQHTLGAAADIYTMDGRDTEFEEWLDTKAWTDKALGYGVASGRGFTHVDLRKDLRWTY
jgi:uncharacterized protein YcbK (DUF882 family)